MGATKSNLEHDHEQGKRWKKEQKPEVSWNDIDPEITISFIDLVERANGAIRFGRSRDGGVYSLGFYLRGEHFTEWISPSDEINLAFENLYRRVAAVFEIESLFPGTLL